MLQKGIQLRNISLFVKMMGRRGEGREGGRVEIPGLYNLPPAGLTRLDPLLSLF